MAPPHGPAAGGTLVTLRGNAFTSGITVRFGPNSASSVTVVDPTLATAVAPAGSGTVAVSMTDVFGQSSSLAATYVYDPPPTVSTVSPATGPSLGGTAITVTGTGFQAGATLTLGGAAASSVVVRSSTQITAVTPPHPSGAVAVTVTNPDGQSGVLSPGFSYTASAAPVLRSLTPTSGAAAGGTTVKSAPSEPRGNSCWGVAFAAHRWRRARPSHQSLDARRDHSTRPSRFDQRRLAVLSNSPSNAAAGT